MLLGFFGVFVVHNHNMTQNWHKETANQRQKLAAAPHLLHTFTLAMANNNKEVSIAVTHWNKNAQKKAATTP